MSAAHSGRLTIAIGDVHGRLDLLRVFSARCLDEAAQRGCTAPLYVFLGDYIDRGQDSAGVISFLREFASGHAVIALRGNHDEMMRSVVLGEDDGRLWAANGMAGTARSYGAGALFERTMEAEDKREAIVEALRANSRAVDDARWLASLPLSHQDEHRIYVHAGLRPGRRLDEQDAHDLIWIREPFLRHRGAFEKLVVHGHTPTDNGKPELRSKRIGLDTGAVFTGVLTAALFDDEQDQPIAIVQTEPQRKEYGWPLT